MNISSTKEIMIFKRIDGERVTYSTGISKKKQDGEYENSYIECRFKKDVNLEHKDKISINSAWLSFYKNKDGKTTFYIFINDFSKGGEVKNDPFAEVEITDDMLD